MRPARNWTMYVPESESALRKKCIELSPTFPLSSTSKSSHRFHTDQSGNEHGIQEILRKSSDNLNTNDDYDHDNNAIYSLSSSTKCESTNSSAFDKTFETKLSAIDVDCDRLNSNSECAPLIQISPSKSITLVKQSSTSLIFTKKDVNPVVHRKRITLVHNNGQQLQNEQQSTHAIPNISHSDDAILLPKKRHSFHWNSDRGGAIISSENTKRKHINSWYAVIGSAKELTFDTNNSEESTINGDKLAKKSTYSVSNEQISATDQCLQNRPSNQTNQTNQSISHRASLNAQEMGQHGTASKYNRFEQLLKNLVGRKVSRETTIASSKSASAIIGNANTAGHLSDKLSCASKSDEYVIENQQLNQPLLIKSPEIKISRTPSVHNLSQNDRFTSTSSASTTSLNNSVQQRLWSVLPLLRREGSCTSLHQNRPIVHQRSNVGLKKCETMSALAHSQTINNFEPIKAKNRLRQSPSIATCSRCSSILSLAANGSRYSLNIANGGFVAIKSNSDKSSSIRSDDNRNDEIQSSFSSLSAKTCKLCLNDVKSDKITRIQQCGCQFCIDCMKAYVEFEILEGAYEISCPDAMCPSQGILTIDDDISELVSNDLVEKHKRFRLNREIELDKNRTWCPRAGCETVCLVEPKSSDNRIAQSGSLISLNPVAVKCPTCVEEFCSNCKKTWHPLITCDENARRLAANGTDDSIGIPFDTDLIKCCPMCGVPIEKDEGCAQMMCKRCKHVFCWYCLASLDDDFLLRHYDKGPCKNKLGHSRASVVWHRAQVIGIFASFGILLLVASPLLLLAAPCIVCCKCRACSTSLIDDVDNDFEDPNNGTQR